jgi:hypothetical protein
VLRSSRWRVLTSTTIALCLISGAVSASVGGSASASGFIHQTATVDLSKKQVCAALKVGAKLSGPELVKQVLEFVDTHETNWAKFGIEALVTIGSVAYCTKNEQTALGRLHKVIVLKPKVPVVQSAATGAVYAPIVQSIQTSYAGDDEWNLQADVSFLASKSPPVSNVAVRLLAFTGTQIDAGQPSNYRFSEGDSYSVALPPEILSQGVFYEVEISNPIDILSHWVCGQEFSVDDQGQVTFEYPPPGATPACPQ